MTRTARARLARPEPRAPAIAREPGVGRYAWMFGGVTLALVGGAATIYPIAAIGVIVATVGVWRWLAVGRGLRGLVVTRGITREHVICGDPVEFVLTARNRDPLPVPWLRVVETLPSELELVAPGAREELRTGWTLAPYRRITRRVRFVAGHRGVHRFDEVHVAAGDLLGASVGQEERSMPVTLVVRPRLVATTALDARHDWSGERPTRTGRVDDPSRFAGVRPYAAGDPIRRLHWRATARLGQPVVKRFDPARERNVAIVLDLETRSEPDRLEELCIVAASLARRFEADGAACGLAAAAFAGSARRIAFVAPSAAVGQSGRIGDLLARLGSMPSASFPELLGRMARLVRPGTQLVVVTARDPGPFMPAARRLARSGFGVEMVLLGPASPDHARRSRRVGIPARAVRLDAPWRTSHALELVG